jgi:hypothetical protein
LPANKDQLEYTIRPVANKLPIKQQGPITENSIISSSKNSPQKNKVPASQNDEGSKASDLTVRIQPPQKVEEVSIDNQQSPRQPGQQNQDPNSKSPQYFNAVNRPAEISPTVIADPSPQPATLITRQVLQPVQQPFAFNLIQTNKEAISSQEYKKNPIQGVQSQNQESNLLKPIVGTEIKQTKEASESLGNPIAIPVTNNPPVHFKDNLKDINLNTNLEHKPQVQSKPLDESAQTRVIASMNCLPSNTLQNAQNKLNLQPTTSVNEMMPNLPTSMKTMLNSSSEATYPISLRVEGAKLTSQPIKATLGMSKSSNNSLKNLFQDNNFGQNIYKETVFNYLNQPALTSAEPKQEAKGTQYSPSSKPKEKEQGLPISPLRLKVPMDPQKYARREDPNKSEHLVQNPELNISQKRDLIDVSGRGQNRRANIAAKTLITKIPDGFQKHSDGIYRNRPENSEIQKSRKENLLNTSSSSSKPIAPSTDRPSTDQILYQPLMKRNSKGTCPNSNRNSVSLTESRRNDQAQKIIKQMDGFDLKKEPVVSGSNKGQACTKELAFETNEKSKMDTGTSKYSVDRARLNTQSNRLEPSQRILATPVETNKTNVFDRKMEGEKGKLVFKETVKFEDNSRYCLI